MRFHHAAIYEEIRKMGEDRRMGKRFQKNTGQKPEKQVPGPGLSLVKRTKAVIEPAPGIRSFFVPCAKSYWRSTVPFPRYS